MDQISGVDVDDFVSYLERSTTQHGKPFSKSSIKGYRGVLISMIRDWAAFQGKVDPLTVSKPQKKPVRIRGKEKRRKVPTDAELEALERGLSLRVEQARTEKRHQRYLPRRILTLHVHQVLRHTGMRPGEVLFLPKHLVDSSEQRILVEGAVADGEEGATKSGKLRGDAAKGIRILYVEPQATDAINHWLEIREEFGFPDVSTIFCDESGGFIDADSINTHYAGACALAGLENSVTPYQMRHWRNDWLRRQGVPVELRRDQLGHMEDETNLNYTNVRGEEIRKWLSPKMSPDPGLEGVPTEQGDGDSVDNE